MPAALLAVVVFMGSLFVRETSYLALKHHQDANKPAVTQAEK